MNSQLVHPAPEGIWMKSEDFRSSSCPVDLTAGHLQSLLDVLDGHLVHRKHGAILAPVTSHSNNWDKGLKCENVTFALDQSPFD